MSKADSSGRRLLQAYRLRLKRKRLLWQSYRSRHGLKAVTNRTSLINRDSILAMSVVRNEITRLPFFMDYYRQLGVDHFLMVDNASDDGTNAFLADQPDVSLWSTDKSYRDARFGLDWTTWLLMKHGTGRWCLTVDVDELLVFGGQQTKGLQGLVNWLDQTGRAGFGALMLDMFPKGDLAENAYEPGSNPIDLLNWFDAGPYRSERQRPLGNLWVQGGIREKVFFSDAPTRSPTLNKIPLIKWRRGFAYVNSTHSALPPRLNALYDGPGGDQPSGALLHTKFLPEIVSKSKTEKHRAQHFHAPELFDDYYDAIITGKGLWHQEAVKYENPEQLDTLGLTNSPKFE